MTTNPNTTLSQLAIDRPGAPTVFIRYGLDFCCHGQRSLAEACAEKGLDPGAIVAELDQVAAATPEAGSWEEQPLGELVDFVVARYHDALRRDVPRLVALAEKVERVHAEKPSCPHGLARHLAQVHEALESHLGKEEQILFPMIRSGAGAMALMPVKVMMAEHEDHGESLRRTRELTAELVAPPEACASWRALYAELRRLEQELMEHIHLENNVLFPKALDAGGTLGPRS